MSNFHISFMEQNDIQKSAKVLSIAMLNNPHHIGIFLGNGENERIEIEKMFFELFNNLPGIVFLAKENEKIIGVMRMKSCIGKVIDDPDVFEDENEIKLSGAGEFHPYALQDPYVTVSRHTAPTVQPKVDSQIPRKQIIWVHGVQCGPTSG